MRRIAVAGASGFVGTAFVQFLAKHGYSVTAISRSAMIFPREVRAIRVEHYGHANLTPTAFAGIETAVYLAGRAHITTERSTDPLQEFRAANCEAAMNFARRALDGGVRRLVYVSTIGVNGAETFRQPFRSDDLPRPASAYAQSKFEGEQVLRDLCAERGNELVIIRPPLVYGRGAPGNFSRLLRLVRSGVPLPFGSIRNRRSLISIDNLIDVVRLCCVQPAARDRTFLVSDGQDISTPELVRLLSAAQGHKVTLYPFPPALLRAGATALGWGRAAQQLCGSLQVDPSEACRLLGWQPLTTLADGLRQAATQTQQAQEC